MSNFTQIRITFPKFTSEKIRQINTNIDLANLSGSDVVLTIVGYSISEETEKYCFHAAENSSLFRLKNVGFPAIHGLFMYRGIKDQIEEGFMFVILWSNRDGYEKTELISLPNGAVESVIGFPPITL